MIEVTALMRWSNGAINKEWAKKRYLTGLGIVSIGKLREDINAIVLVNGETIYLDDIDKDNLVRIMEDERDRV